MASAQWCCLLLFFLFQMAAFGASAPLEPGVGGGGEGEGGGGGGAEEAPKDGSALILHGVSSTLIKSSESRNFPSGETEAKEGQKATKSKDVEQSVPSSHVQNPELSRHPESAIFQDNAKPPQADSHVISSEKSKKFEPLPPAADSNKVHTSKLDSATQNLDLNEVEQGEDLPPKPESPPDVPVPDSVSKKPDPKEVKEPPKGLPPGVSAADSKKSDLKEGKETPKNLPPDAHVPDSVSKKPDPKEVKEVPKGLPPGVSVADSKKSDLKEVKETPQNLPPDAHVPDSISDSEKLVQNGKLPTPVENNLSVPPVLKYEEDGEPEEDEEEMIDDGKVGEETAGASQSEKEEAKSLPAGPTPKNGSENSHFFAYLVTTAIVVAALYIAYHNKRKIIAFALEGKKSKVVRRPKSSDYQRLDQKI